MSELTRLRSKIDILDRRLVKLLNQRLATVGRIGTWKAERGLASYSPKRSAEILRNVCTANAGPSTAGQLRRIYRQIIAASVQLQSKQRSARRKGK